jgi:cell wall-associated NlpC family hydrolase
MQLQVPKGGVVPTSSAGTAPSTTTATKPASPAAAAYTVVRNDSLSGIAQQLGVKLTSLLTTNQMTVSSMIYPGMRLKVPAGGRATTTTAAPSTTTPATTAPTTTAPAPKPATGPVPAKVQTVLAFARAQLGKPYKFNTAGPNSYDCSGLTLAAYATVGIDLPHYSGAQMAFGAVVDWTTEAIRPGDLVFLETAVGSGVIGHVGIATGPNTWIQAPRTGDVIREGSFTTTRVVGVRRLVAD